MEKTIVTLAQARRSHLNFSNPFYLYDEKVSAKM